MTKTARTLALASLLPLAAAPASANTYKSYEAPDYQVEQGQGAAEIRLYRAHLAAEVTVSGDRRTAASRAFRILAGYIFGRNETQAKIAMTVPVSQIPVEEGYVVRFMLPKSWDRVDLPKPDSAAIRFRTVDPGRQAVLRFSGMSSRANLERHREALLAFMEAQGIEATGPIHYYFYDDPFTLPFKRRNEVAFPID